MAQGSRSDTVITARAVAAELRKPAPRAPYPWLAWYSRLWGMVHDITREIGHPVAPNEWVVR